MSEFQYYEFQAIDRLLTKEDRQAVQQLSSRARVGNNRAIFIYNYGDFRGNPDNTLVQYFDAMLYTSNFGSKCVAFKLPQHLVDIDGLKAYEIKYTVDVTLFPNDVIVSLSFNNEEGGGDWIEEDDVNTILSELLPIRRQILLGDYRALYLTCLANFSSNEEQLSSLPVPYNLKDLNNALMVLTNFFEMDTNIINRYADKSIDQQTFHHVNIDRLSEQEVRHYLKRMLNGEACVDIEIIGKLKQGNQ